MAIIKVINGKKHIVANNITKHNQLEDRTDYGCHPIRAIRDLPEKLTQLKDKDAELEEQINSIFKNIPILILSTIPYGLAILYLFWKKNKSSNVHY